MVKCLRFISINLLFFALEVDILPRRRSKIDSALSNDYVDTRAIAMPLLPAHENTPVTDTETAERKEAGGGGWVRRRPDNALG